MFNQIPWSYTWIKGRFYTDLLVFWRANVAGNCFYNHLTYDLSADLIPKQINLYSIAKYGNKILEVGFNAGHSALLFLIANPNCNIVCFDICIHSYTELCLEYLNKHFDDRIQLHKGDSKETLPLFKFDNPNYNFDIVHIDGDHSYIGANLDFFNTKSLTRNDSIIIWDDVNICYLETLWNGYINSGILKPFELLKIPQYPHAFGTIIKPERKIGVCSLTIGEKYKEITKYGRRSKIIYCDINNYDFYDEEDILDIDRPPAWSKINLILKHLKNYDYIVWVDGDSHIMSNEPKLENIICEYMKEKDILVAQDYTMINTGVIFVKNTDWSYDFLKLVYDQIDFLHHSNWEQAAFIYLLDNNEMESKDHITVLELYLQNKINAYWYNFTWNNRFILHFLGCWRDNVENGLSLAMNAYCPLKKDDEDNETFLKRLKWIQYESEEFSKKKLQSNTHT